MDSDEHSLSEETGSITTTAADEARFQRRRAAFRRRTTSVLIGLVLVVALALWQRSRSVLQRCQTSLSMYGASATHAHLEREHVELIASSWDALDIGATFAPAHYHVFSDNWLKRPEKSEAVPLAICDTTHGSVTGRGRWLLVRTTNGLETRWVDEAGAKALLENEKFDENENP